MIIALSPLLIVLALVVKLTSAGPVLYRQERIGLNGQPFDMLKFRSMRVNADAELEALLAAQGKGDTPLFKLDNDPRITRSGTSCASTRSTSSRSSSTCCSGR